MYLGILTEWKVSPVDDALRGATGSSVVIALAPSTIRRPHEGDTSHFIFGVFTMVVFSQNTACKT